MSNDIDKDDNFLSYTVLIYKDDIVLSQMCRLMSDFLTAVSFNLSVLSELQIQLKQALLSSLFLSLSGLERFH